MESLEKESKVIFFKSLEYSSPQNNLCHYLYVIFMNCTMNYKTFHLLYRLSQLNTYTCIDFYHSELKNIHMSE